MVFLGLWVHTLGIHFFLDPVSNSFVEVCQIIFITIYGYVNVDIVLSGHSTNSAFTSSVSDKSPGKERI